MEADDGDARCTVFTVKCALVPLEHG